MSVHSSIRLSVCLSICQYTNLSVHPPIHWCVMHHFQVKKSRVKVTHVIQNLCCVALWLFNRFTSYLGQIQPMRWQCAMHHFQVKRSKVKVTWVIQIFAVSTSCPLPIWAIHFTWCTNTTWEDTMCYASFPGWKVKVQGHTSRSYLEC